MLRPVSVNRHEVAFLQCETRAIRRIPVQWKSQIASLNVGNMWTRSRGLLRQSHAIL